MSTFAKTPHRTAYREVPSCRDRLAMWLVAGLIILALAIFSALPGCSDAKFPAPARAGFGVTMKDPAGHGDVRPGNPPLSGYALESILTGDLRTPLTSSVRADEMILQGYATAFATAPLGGVPSRHTTFSGRSVNHGGAGPVVTRESDKAALVIFDAQAAPGSLLNRRPHA